MPTSFQGKGLKILTAGVPLSTKGHSITAGLERVKELELDGMEVEFVYGVKGDDKYFEQIKEKSKELGLILTVHAPYYINLASKENEKLEKSKQHIIDTVIAGIKMGAYSIVFHPGFYQDISPLEVSKKVFYALEDIMKKIKEMGYDPNDIWIRPETMGKPSQYGNIEELSEISKHFPNVLPCVDFSHLFARSIGKANNYKEFEKIINVMVKELGEKVLHDLHIHLSGILYTSKGEKVHTVFEESPFNFREVLKLLHDIGAEGVIVSESANIEGDALIMKKALKYLKENKELTQKEFPIKEESQITLEMEEKPKSTRKKKGKTEGGE